MLVAVLLSICVGFFFLETFKLVNKNEVFIFYSSTYKSYNCPAIVRDYLGNSLIFFKSSIFPYSYSS